MRVFINGFGRIGRSVLRAWAQNPGGWPGLEIAGINDIAAADMCAYLFQYDSVFGPWRGTVSLSPGALVVNGNAIPLHRTPDISSLSLLDVDVVLECTGRADTVQVASRGLVAGARRILISGPTQAADLTVVLGANDQLLENQRIVSNAYNRAKVIIQASAAGLEAVAMALLDRESLDGAEVRTLLGGGSLPPMPPSSGTKADSSEATQRVLRPETGGRRLPGLEPNQAA